VLAQNLSIARFDPTPAGDRFFGVDSAEVRGRIKLDVRLTLDYAHNPLVFHSANDNATVVAVIEHQLIGDLGVAITLWDRLSVNIDLPVALVQTGPSPRAPRSPPSPLASRRCQRPRRTCPPALTP
jgi:hypothetical protein